MKLFLCKYNKITGYWNIVREVNKETKDAWLKIFKQDEPNEIFKVSLRKPK